MRGFLSQLHFARPVFLLLLLLLPLLWLRLRALSLPVVLWRTVIFILLIFSLADPQVITEARKREERIFVFDLSRSIPSSMRLWMGENARKNFALGPGDRVFVFAGETREVKDWEPWVRGEVSSSSIKPGETHLESLFSSLLRLPQAPRRVFLFTDGWETRGEIQRLFPSLALSGLKVFPVVPLERLHIANVAVKKVLAPQHGINGQAIQLKVVVENQGKKEVKGNLILQRGNEVLKREAVTIRPGSHLYSYKVTLPEGPMVSFQAGFVPGSPGSDLVSEDNQATAWVAVQSKEKALVLNGRSDEGRYLEEILKRRGYEVTSVIPREPPPSPSSYAFVVFNNVEREKFPAAYLAEMERYVAGGRGFLILGDEAGFGAGAYRQTPIEKLLPVDFREPKRDERNRALILVIDKSGSMREGNRLLYAKEAAKAVLSQLKERDLLGVLGFDVEPFVVVPLGPLERIRGSAAAEIDRLTARGKTYLYPALIEAKRQLQGQRASRKHVIILSDGETGGSGSEYIDLVTSMKEELKITVSAVAIGDQANIPLLKRIALYGGGFFHHTYDPTTLPQIVLEQMRDKPEEKPSPDKDFTPVPVTGSEILAGFPAPVYPRLRGYLESELKKGARMDLAIPSKERRDPLLASWSYGKGKVVAFTADLSGRWTNEWIRWELLERFWDGVFGWIHPKKTLPEGLPPYEVRIDLVNGHPVMDLYLYRETGNGGLFRYSYSGAGMRGEGVLKKLAPGHYQTSLPFSAPGSYRIELAEERQGTSLPYPPVGYTLTFDPRSEIPRRDLNTDLLHKLAQSSGGEINPGGGTGTAEEVIRSANPVRFYPLLLAPVLFLLEIIFRRFFLRLQAT